MITALESLSSLKKKEWTTYFLFWPLVKWDLGSLTRDRSCTTHVGSMEL